MGRLLISLLIAIMVLALLVLLLDCMIVFTGLGLVTGLIVVACLYLKGPGTSTAA